MTSQPYFNEKKRLLEAWLESAFAPADKDVSLLLDAVRYSTLQGGKRFRGMIVLSMADWLGESRSMLALAGAVEMIHAYSLIHDDLPAMDNDDLRRGKPTNHIVFGEARAILAGDFLLSEAHRLLVKGLREEGFGAERILDVMAYLGEVLGSSGMVGGQEMDMSLTGKVVGMSELEKIHRLKTGRFIEFSFVAPVVLSRGTRALSDPIDLSDFALNLGLLFQVVDDILDAIAQQDILGKPVGSDAGNHKATYVALLGVSQAQKAAQELENKLLLMLYDIKDPLLKEGLLSWVDQVANRDR